MKTVAMKSGEFFGVLLITIFFGLLVSYPLMLLWNNCLVPSIDFIQPVTWLQTFGIYVFVRLMHPKTTTIEHTG